LFHVVDAKINVLLTMHHVNLLTETGEELSVYADNVKGRI
jgi:hypothetical protein